MTTVAAVWCAIVFFLAPGFVLAWVSGLRAPAAMAAALPVTFGVVGLGAWVWGLTSAPFTLWTFGVTLVVALAGAVAWRAVFARRVRARTGSTWRAALLPADWRAGSVLDPSWLLPAAGVVTGAWMFISDRMAWLVRAPHGVDNIVQGWDVQWHANSVRFIMDEGIASPTRMGELQNVETHTALLYPSAYHAGIALFGEATGLDPIPALNIAQLVLPAIALPMSMACLVFAFMRSRGLTAQIAAGLAAAGIYAAPQLMWVGEYVGMWPYLFAMSLTGIVIWQFVSVPGRRAGAFAAVLGFLGTLSVHPSTVTVIVLAVGLSWLTSTLVRPDRGRLADTLWLAGPGIVGSLLFLPQVLAGTEQAEEVSGWEAIEAGTNTGGWAGALHMDTRHVAEFFPAFDPTVALWLALAGAVVMVCFRGQIWPALFYAFSLAATVNSVDPLGTSFGDILAVVGNVHYNTPHRLIFPVVMSVWAAAAIAVAATIRVLTLAPLAARNGGRTWVMATTAASTVVAVVLAAATVPGWRAETHDGARQAYTAARYGGRMVGENDLAAFAWLASRPEAFEGYTLGDPADGHSWLYAATGVPTISRHYLWPAGGAGSATDIALFQANALGEGLRGEPNATNTVDEAVERLGVNFYMLSPGSFWAFQRTLRVTEDGLWTAAGATPVYRKGNVTIFAVDARFTEAELREMQRDALTHGSEPLDSLSEANAARAARSASSQRGE